MKKILFLLFIIIALGYWANANRNELAVWFNTDSFYRPIYTGNINVLQSGSTIHAELKPSYDVRHGFFITFPCESVMPEFFSGLDGSIRYTFRAEGVELMSKAVSFPSNPISGMNDDHCDIALFTFDLPFEGHESITLDVTIESPITKLAAYQKEMKCEVSPAYWPK
ncbi:hypothetical protein [Pseudodesulfovibrio sp. zrk46]|uniref:hypothetical protein n=1 Tax=Pseudodesulfovibrio sp. zrk46 TaxID=2725288 RepID=UPI0014493D04|nr:hypothetical protein [Pseudodesulfovibrio sp. zrk46]QJB55883.1 hypothetical protein HFN16_05435 [Pseudodesulfovibrio sp. zrk46]